MPVGGRGDPARQVLLADCLEEAVIDLPELCKREERSMSVALNVNGRLSMDSRCGHSVGEPAASFGTVALVA